SSSVQEESENSRGTQENPASKDDSTPIREASSSRGLETPVKTPPASTARGPLESTPSPSTQ
ncbi:hypothetical protein KI387_011595, partial [Taxus chinensis]